MSPAALTGITIELGTLTRLLAAAHLLECAGWAEAEHKAEEDLELWRGQIPSARPHSIDIVPDALICLIDTAEEAIKRPGISEEPWARQVAADVAVFGQVCHNPHIGWGSPRHRQRRKAPHPLTKTPL